MHPRRVTLMILCAGLLLAAAASCDSTQQLDRDTQQEQNQAKNQAQKNPTEGEIQADCFVNLYLTAWEDLDADGVWDAGEPPLEGVEFRMSGSYAHSLAGGKGTSDAEGEAAIDAWAPGGCPNPFDLSVQAQAPDGYRLTTDPEVVHDGAAESVGRYQFGFAAEE